MTEREEEKKLSLHRISWEFSIPISICSCVHLSTAVPLQSVIWEVWVCVVSLIRNDVWPLDVIYGFDPGQSCQLLIVQYVTVSLRLLCETGERGRRRERERNWVITVALCRLDYFARRMGKKSKSQDKFGRVQTRYKFDQQEKPNGRHTENKNR